MSLNRLLSAAAVAALIASPALAQTPAAAKTEAEAQAATGKATTDTPAATQPQGAAQAVSEASPAATGQAAAASTAASQVSPSGDLIETLKLEMSVLPLKRRYMAFNNTVGEFVPPKHGTLVITYKSDKRAPSYEWEIPSDVLDQSGLSEATCV